MTRSRILLAVVATLDAISGAGAQRLATRADSDQAVLVAAVLALKGELPGPVKLAVASTSEKRMGSSGGRAEISAVAAAAGVDTFDLTTALRACAARLGKPASMSVGHDIGCEVPGAKSVVAFLEPPTYDGDRADVLVQWWSDTRLPSKGIDALVPPAIRTTKMTFSETWYVILGRDGSGWRVLSIALGIRDERGRIR